MSNPIRILIVEDSSNDYELAVHEISQVVTDIQFMRVQTREDYLAALDSFQSDLILTDYTLPQFDGMTALKLAITHAPEIPVILWTSSLNEEVAVECVKVGASNYVLKNNIKRLRLAVLRALEEKNIRAERLRATEELRQSRELLHSAFVSLPEAIFIVDAATVKIIDCNPAASQIFGYPHAEMLGQTTSFLHVDSERLAEFRQLLGKAIAEKGILYLPDFSMKRKNGTVFPTEHTVTPIKNEDDQITGWVSVVRDITERKRIEDNLRSSEDKFRKAFETSPDSININRLADGLYVSINQGFTQITGYTEAEVIGRTSFEMNIWNDPAQREKLIAGLRENKLVENLEAQFRMKNGTLKDGLMSAAIIEIDRVPHILSITRDITERKRAEKDQTYQANLLANLNDAVTASDEHFNLMMWNRAAEHMFGWQAAEVLGRSGQEVFRSEFIGIDRAEVFRRVTATGQFRGEMIQYRKDGTPIAVEANTYAIKDEAGRRTGYVTVSRDITERKRAEASLQESEKRYRLISENSADVIWVMDPLTGQFTYVSPSVQKLRGYTPAEVMAHPAAESLTPESLRLVSDLLATRLPTFVEKGTGSASYVDEVDQPCRDGSIVHTEVTTTYYFNEHGQVEIVGVSRNINERKRHARELEAIVSVSGALRSADLREDMISIIVAQVSLLLNAHSVAMGLLAENADYSEVTRAVGGWSEIQGRRFPLEDSISGYVLTTGKPYLTNDLSHDPLLRFPRCNEIFKGGVCVPLIAQGEAIGWLFAGLRTTLLEDNIRILSAIADIAANAIRRATWHERTQQTAEELERAYETTLEGWAHALELRDQETTGHSRRVVQLTMELAQAMGVPSNQWVHLRRGALLHDLGKMGIPDSVLLKHGTLNEREWELMRQHPDYGYRLLQPIDYLRPALDIPYCHHEKWDGTGYPRGLKGEQIPFAARVFALADVWDALTTDRPYRAAWDTARALAYMREQAGKHFDPEMVPVFVRLLARDP